jgi:hypothetical protein
MFGEGFERLTEEQKVRVREALGKAWGRPEVSEARDRMMKANEEMRDAIHAALKEIDPEMAMLLANVMVMAMVAVVVKVMPVMMMTMRCCRGRQR